MNMLLIILIAIGFVCLIGLIGIWFYAKNPSNGLGVLIAIFGTISVVVVLLLPFIRNVI